MSLLEKGIEIQEEFKLFIENHEKSVKGNKKAGTRSRKNSSKLSTLLKEYRKVSVSELAGDSKTETTVE